MRRPAVPLFARLWRPPAPAVPARRPVLLPQPSTSAPVRGGPEETFLEDVEVESCAACGWRWGSRPTRCRCVGALPHTARAREPERHWTERVDP